MRPRAHAGLFDRQAAGKVPDERAGEAVARSVRRACHVCGRWHIETCDAVRRLDAPAARPLGHHERPRRVRVVGEPARLARVGRAADDDVRDHPRAVERLLPPRRHDEDLGRPRPLDDARVLRREERRAARRQDMPVKRVVYGRVQRPPDDEDRALTAGGDQRDVARLRLVAPCAVHLRAGRLERRPHVGRRIVVAERREHVHLGAALRQLRERDAAAPTGDPDRLVEVQDVARRRQRRHARDRDVLDVPDHRDARRRGHPRGCSGRRCTETA
jgi:hypothetical protein